MKKLLLSLTFIVLVFIVTGCGSTNNGNKNPAGVSSLSSSTIQRQPIGDDPIELAMDYCASYGYNLVMRFDEQEKTNKQYCQFPNNYACEVLSFKNGFCNTSSTNRIYLDTTNNLVQNVRECEITEDPVCSTNGITYVNACIATLQNALISHQGACTIDEQKIVISEIVDLNPPPSKPTSKSSSKPTSKSSGKPTSKSSGKIEEEKATATLPTGRAAWTQILLDMNNKHLTGSAAPRLEECVYGSTKVYFYMQSCPFCFSTLYDFDSEIICHPHNDIDNSCPSYFNLNKRGAYCKQI